MPLSKLAHYSIRTTDLERSRHFYTRVLGLREGFRPLASNVQDFWATLRQEGYRWRDRTVPSLGLDQVFVDDPCRVTIQMIFPATEVASLPLPIDAAANKTRGVDR